MVNALPPPVLMNDFVAQWRAVGDEVLDAVRRVGESGWLVLGKEVERFEADLAARSRASHVVGVASGLDALEIALRTAGVGPGDKVLTTPVSAFATTLAILRLGAVPVFVDVDATGLLDLTLAGEALRRLPETKAILPVHLFGHALDLDALESLAKATGVTVLEDAAQSIDARSRGRAVGSVSLAWASSFYPTKNLGAMGDAGALFTDDDGVAKRARSLRDYGQTAKYVHAELGMNSRLDELHAAILRTALLPRLSASTERRRAIAKRYRDGLRNAHLSVPPAPPGSESVFHLFPVLVTRGHREAFMKHLQAARVGSGIHYPILISDQEALRGAEHVVVGDLTVARSFAENEVSLPMHPFLTDADVDRVLATCNEWRPEGT
ncbi:MAG: DegT/DnrJ/EryC1/StrS family aminotransferase [Polyangiaceae bacterium]